MMKANVHNVKQQQLTFYIKMSQMDHIYVKKIMKIIIMKIQIIPDILKDAIMMVLQIAKSVLRRQNVLSVGEILN